MEQNSSVLACLRSFSSSETLRRGDKFYCEACCSLQEAQKRLRLARLPRVLVLQLKRFKFVERLQRHRKLNYRVAFPHELKLSEVRLSGVDHRCGAGRWCAASHWPPLDGRRRSLYVWPGLRTAICRAAGSSCSW